MMETRTNGDAAWRMSDAPANFLNDKLDGIVGFEIAITQVLAKSKLSQNKSDADRLGAATALGAHPIAERMKNLSPK
jgi:transcriptional regulator